ncbi:catechol 2,3-dioxygenase-like lactoylglutathione lyase family enzyme [Phyllobacterium ifriqiyense]|uniref:Catechol 2,3-dioxygenase-like lactoylglutathione lyase family enzyme n=1 Tax=Phyllobacterium ifriqiyense TaxID=314238 RepID=A0ABU0SAG5_9HYPH|nr:hypothetical protein [Phyllobacterium ifriqiyense]MDQ0997734.1 catechol 2,3-dioxygenase-like lactoylglutathione lyase family enzyme [Phyllobacterium ifriqiyense]
MRPSYEGSHNIAMKVPPHQYEATVAFYRDIIGLEPLTNHLPYVGFHFGSNQLWIDKAPGLSQSELWLEIAADNVGAAAGDLAEAGIVRCDEIEELPEGHKDFWITSPCQIIHHVSQKGEGW